MDWTAADTNLYAGQTRINITGYQGYGCPSGGICRGLYGTAAVAHQPGELFALENSTFGSYQTDAVQSNTGGMFYGALASAAEHGTVYTDQTTGKILTGERAWQTYRRWFPSYTMFGGAASCAANTITNCDNPMWGMHPRGTPGNVRLVGSTLRYNAPDGAACRYAVSAAPFASTDDSGDTASITGPRARSISVPSGTQYYRISCGLTGRATGEITVP